MTAVNHLQAIFDAILREVEVNPDFADRIDEVLRAVPDSAPTPRPHRRARGAIDPFGVYQEGAGEELRRRLQALDLERLKDIIAEHGMDRSRLAMKWRTPERLIDLIVETVASRSRKGDAFRTPASRIERTDR